MLRISPRGLCCQVHAVQASMIGCRFHGRCHGEHTSTFRAHCLSRFMWSSPSVADTPQVPDRRFGHPMFGRSVCQLRAEQMMHTTCWVLIRRVSQWTKPFSSRNVVLFLQYPVFSSMTRSAHCNRIFARSVDCGGVVSHAMHCVLIAASSVQHAEAVLVGLAPRCQDANATRNIPHVARTTEAVAASMLKRALVRQIERASFDQ